MAAAGPAWGIVLAAGRGDRFGSPKQLACLGGFRLIDWTVAATLGVCDRAVVALPAGVPWDGDPRAVGIAGGASHAESARRAMALVPDDAAVVVVAAASHPFASPRSFRDVVAAVRNGADGAVAVYPFHDMLTRVQDGVVLETIPKAGAVVAQSPSAFDARMLRACMATEVEVVFEVELIERAGGQVVTVDGDAVNVHITTPEELALAELLLPAVGWRPDALGD